MSRLFPLFKAFVVVVSLVVGVYLVKDYPVAVNVLIGLVLMGFALMVFVLFAMLLFAAGGTN
jgi:hypothetical protein